MTHREDDISRELSATPPEIKRLLPKNGSCIEADYLRTTNTTNWLIEFTDGTIDVLRMPTTSHQQIVAHLVQEFSTFISCRGLGQVIHAPFCIRLRPGLI